LDFGWVDVTKNGIGGRDLEMSNNGCFKGVEETKDFTV